MFLISCCLEHNNVLENRKIMLTQPKTVLISKNIVAMIRSYQVAINNITERYYPTTFIWHTTGFPPQTFCCNKQHRRNILQCNFYWGGLTKVNDFNYPQTPKLESLCKAQQTSQEITVPWFERWNSRTISTDSKDRMFLNSTTSRGPHRNITQ